MNDPQIGESSGVVASRRFKDVLWTHNDANNLPQLFAIRENGTLIRTYNIPDAENRDWEDIALDEQGRLFVLDNTSRIDPNQRNFVYIVSEPHPGTDEELTSANRISARFPDGSFDCETIFVWQGKIYLITKPWDGSLPRIYRLDNLQQGGVATFIGTVPVQAMITGGDISSDGTRIVLSSYRAILIFEGQGSPEQLLQSEPMMCPLNARQVEAVAWRGDELILTNEQREVYHIARSRWEHQRVPFLKSQERTVPFVHQKPSVDQSLANWPKGSWLEASLNGRATRIARVAWSPEGLHFGIDLPSDIHLPSRPGNSHPDFDDWFRPGSVYLMVNPDGSRPVVYGKNDRCICLGRSLAGLASAHIHILRPGTVVEWTDMSPEWIQTEEHGQRLLVTLKPQAAGMEELKNDMTLGFNLLMIRQDGEMISWAMLSRRFSWDSPSTWGLLKLDD